VPGAHIVQPQVLPRGGLMGDKPSRICLFPLVLQRVAFPPQGTANCSRVCTLHSWDRKKCATALDRQRLLALSLRCPVGFSRQWMQWKTPRTIADAHTHCQLRMLFIPGMASGMIYVPCDKYLKAYFLFVLSTNRCLLRVRSSLLGVDYLPVECLSCMEWPHLK
jgi:hypothetical protein